MVPPADLTAGVSFIYTVLLHLMKAHVQGKEQPRSTFFNISSFQILAMFRRGLFYSYLSIYLRYFLGLSVTETTFFATFPMILNVAFQTFVWGVISDRYQKRRTLIILGEISAAVITVAVWYMHTLPASKHLAGYVIIIGLATAEIFWSMSNVAWSALISDLYPEYDRAGVQGRLSSLGALGRIVGVWIGGLAYDGLSRFYEGWGFHSGLLFFVASGVMLVSTVPMFFVPEGGIRAASHYGESSDTVLRRLAGSSGYSRKFLMFLLSMVLINFGRNCVAVTKTQYLVLDGGFNVSSRLLSYIVNMESGAIFLFGLFVGWLSRRLRDEVILLWGSGIGAAGLIGFAFANALPLIFVSSFLTGVSMVVVRASSYAYASRLIPAERRGKEFALYNATFFLSWGVGGTLITGPIVDLLIRSGATQVFSYKVSFMSAAALVLIGIVVLGFVNRMDDSGRRGR
jgi:MFS family permease